MQKFSQFKKLAKHFYTSLDDGRRNVFKTVLVSFAVLLLGGVFLFFTKDTVPETKDAAVRLTCRDSDYFDTYKKGAVTYTDTKGSHVDEDYCAGDGAVFEMTCHKTSFWGSSAAPEKKTAACSKGCINGACQK